jgi:hypothetical protein
MVLVVDDHRSIVNDQQLIRCHTLTRLTPAPIRSLMSMGARSAKRAWAKRLVMTLNGNGVPVSKVTKVRRIDSD